MNNLKTIILTLFILTQFPQVNTAGQSGKNISADQAATDRPGENFFNTATKEISGRKYKVVIIGDLRPDLSIDGIPLPANHLGMYQNVIEELSDTIWERQRKEAAKRNAIIEKTKQDILNDIIARGIFTSKNAMRSFYLTSRQLLVNEKKQEEDDWVYFKNKYIKSADQAYYYEKP